MGYLPSAEPQLSTFPISFLSLPLSRMKNKKENGWTRVRKWRRWRREDESSLPRAIRLAMDQDQEPHPFSYLMVSSRNSLFSLSWAQPSNPNLSSSLCMNESWVLDDTLSSKGKIQVLLQLNLLKFFFKISHLVYGYFGKNFGFHPKGLEEWIFKCYPLILVTRNSQKIPS